MRASSPPPLFLSFILYSYYSYLILINHKKESDESDESAFLKFFFGREFFLDFFLWSVVFAEALSPLASHPASTRVPYCADERISTASGEERG